jgi:hypothetical protein
MGSFKEPNYDDLSFEQLARDDPEFRVAYAANSNWLDFQNPHMVKYDRNQLYCDRDHNSH